MTYLWWLITISFVSEVWQVVLVRERTYYKLEGKSLIGNVSETRKVKDFSDCAFICLRLGVSSCLSFNIAKVTDIDRHYSCELSTSEKYLEPDESFKDRITHDYYGTTTEFLFRLFPCISSPCNYGGTCTPGKRLGIYYCQCLPEVTVLPFMDDKCNVDKRKMIQGKAVKGVFHVKVDRYRLNYDDAKNLCTLHGAQLATYSQLDKAQQAGAEQCAFVSSNSWSPTKKIWLNEDRNVHYTVLQDLEP
ncbi:hypothetical protein AWC38_SpisGene19159 [Stylophora pistillata]|uniref:Uncharacterized protein n=1 Tax=Stylophora pistillata TaxID=50429 RepID=A0A2B4RJM8_STYPI|nr:hypothetical protein AWC38_SpisGene19159 [Stylophora pistillata]